MEFRGRMSVNKLKTLNEVEVKDQY